MSFPLTKMPSQLSRTISTYTKTRQDKTIILDSRLTDYTIPTLTFPTHEQSRAAQSNANDPPYDDDDQDKQDKMPYDDDLTISVPDT